MVEPEKTPNQETPPVSVESAMEIPESSAGLETLKVPERSAEAPARSIPEPARIPAQGGVVKDETVKKVETVLEEGLDDTYKALDSDTQKKFREEGERVTREVVGMMRKMKTRARKILDLIRGWLKIIPQVNRHFLDQEAKIKTDKIMRLADAEREKQELV